MTSKTTREIAQIVGGEVIGRQDLAISGITNIDNPLPHAITYILDPLLLPEVESTPIACILVPPSVSSSHKTLIRVKNPKLAWAKLLSLFHPPRGFEPVISKLANISPSAEMGKVVTVEAYVTIGERVKIGNGCVIRSGSYIDQDVQIGEGSILHPNVTLYEKTLVGKNVIIHAGCVIGSDGFGYVPSGKEQIKIPQLGNVRIEDNVEIGANTTIDRATLGFTLIRKGAKIDNLVQIAHNVEIGENTVASSQVGISGSSKIGNNVILAGQVGISDHCEVGDEAIVGAQAGLPTKKKIPAKQIFFGSPARPYSLARKALAAQGEVADTIKLVRELKRRVAELEKELKALKLPQSQ